MPEAILKLTPNKVTICIPNYKTLEFTKLCVRSIRKFSKYPYEVIVVDNDSADESLEYLKSLSWIKLIARKSDGNLKGSVAEGSALDIGLQNCNTEYYMIMHSDTFVTNENWPGGLIGYFAGDEKVACVGSDKIDLTPAWQSFLQKATDVRGLKRKLLSEESLQGKFRHHNRTICCVYRTAVLKDLKVSFMPVPEKRLTAGQKLYFDIEDNGYKALKLPTSILKKYVTHLNHATQIVNPSEFGIRKKKVKIGSRNIQNIMESALVKDIMSDDSLDK